MPAACTSNRRPATKAKPPPSRSADDDEGWGFSFSSVSERLLDPATGKEITRPSLDVLTLIVLALYFAAMEAGRGGATIGKRSLRSHGDARDGRPLGFAAALGRNAIISSFIFPVAILVAFFSRRRRQASTTHRRHGRRPRRLNRGDGR